MLVGVAAALYYNYAALLLTLVKYELT